MTFSAVLCLTSAVAALLYSVLCLDGAQAAGLRFSHDAFWVRTPPMSIVSKGAASILIRDRYSPALWHITFDCFTAQPIIAGDEAGAAHCNAFMLLSGCVRRP